MGPFVALDVAYGVEDFDLSEAEEDLGTNLSADDALGVGLRAGAFVRPWVALELQVQAFDEIEIDVAGQESAGVSLGAATVNAKFHNDLTERLHLYGLVGLGVAWADLDDPRDVFTSLDSFGVAGRAGLGLEGTLGIPLYWFVEASLLEPFEDLDGLRVIALTGGLGWRFGSD